MEDSLSERLAFSRGCGLHSANALKHSGDKRKVEHKISFKGIAIDKGFKGYGIALSDVTLVEV